MQKFSLAISIYVYVTNYDMRVVVAFFVVKDDGQIYQHLMEDYWC